MIPAVRTHQTGSGAAHASLTPIPPCQRTTETVPGGERCFWEHRAETQQSHFCISNHTAIVLVMISIFWYLSPTIRKRAPYEYLITQSLLHARINNFRLHLGKIRKGSYVLKSCTASQ